MSVSKRNTFITRRDRELDCRNRPGDSANVHSSLATNIKAHHTWDPRKTVHDTDHGGIFNFDFSKNGSILGAACERKSVLLFDPFNGKLIASKTDAHTDCVNCVKFLDDRLFATCSDDTTVALWDTRYLKHNIQTFRGHSNWVKNIEYDSKQGILLTSGFDGCIYTWNINRYSNEESSNKVFYTSGLMRSKLSPDFDKLIISTHEGYIIVVHNLDLSTLSEDLKGFKPNMYRLMQRSQTPLRIGIMYNHVFEQERNRVQFIADWPTGNDANIISSLQIHPQGWCILSRNTDSSENTEWTCVHELQDQHQEKKIPLRPWEMERVTPHTSSAYCSSTNTPAYSSLAPSNHHSANENQSENSNNQSTSNRMTNAMDQDTVQPTSIQSGVNRNASRRGTSVLPGLDHYRRDINSPDNNSTDGTFRPAPVEISGGPQGASNTTQLERHAAVSPQTTGPIHNSLIQIRRGARQEDGSFSFSISVHTSSGRTIEFNQDDLASDDDEIRIERIIPNPHSDPDSGIRNLNTSYSRPIAEVNRSLVPVHSDAEMASDIARETTTSVDRESSQDIVRNSGVLRDTSRTSASATGQIGGITSGASGSIDSERTSSHRMDTAANSVSREIASQAGNSVAVENERNSSLHVGPDIAATSILGETIFRHEAQATADGLSDTDHDNSGPVPLIDHNVDYYDSISSDDENESYHDLIAEDQYEFSNDSDDEGAMGSSFDIEYTNEETGSEVNVTIEDRGHASANNEPDGLFRNSGPSRLRRRAGSSRTLRHNSSRGNREFQSMLNTQTAYPSSVTTNVQNSSPQIANSLDTRPRNNSFMFVLESNTGIRRRRILNLSYLDSYTETENNRLQKDIHGNKNRLLSYIEECNVGRGFIKEVAFSHDGRLISSPFGFGLRIFAFDSYCNELCDRVPTSPVKLYEVTCSLAHVNCVVATKFSPVHNMIVSGCLDGKVAFHQPVL